MPSTVSSGLATARVTRSPIRILVVDDHVLLREGVRAVIETQADMTIVGEAA